MFKLCLVVLLPCGLIVPVFEKNGIYILQVVGWVQVGEGVDSGDGGWFQWGRGGGGGGMGMGFSGGGGGGDEAANVRGIEGEQKANVRGPNRFFLQFELWFS